MNRWATLVASTGLLLCGLDAVACEQVTEYYLRWNTDHTERAVRPAYLLSEAEAQQLPAYHVCRDIAGRIVDVSFYLYGTPSEASAFGTHQVVISYAPDRIERRFLNLEGTTVLNRSQVAVERYSDFVDGFPERKDHFGINGSELIDDNTGTSTFLFERDREGRRIVETRYDSAGELVLEHNGFEQAHFAFDANDYARYRRGFDRDGKPMAGSDGYHTAYFWFDGNGTFTAEEFRDLDDEPALFSSGDYFRVEFHDIDPLGNWHTIKYFDMEGEPLTRFAAIGESEFDAKGRRESVRYLSEGGAPQARKDGTAKIQFRYGKDGALESMDRFDINGELIQ